MLPGCDGHFNATWKCSDMAKQLMVIMTLQHNLKDFKERLEFTLALPLHSSTVFIQSARQSSQGLKAQLVRSTLFCVYLSSRTSLHCTSTCVCEWLLARKCKTRNLCQKKQRAAEGVCMHVRWAGVIFGTFHIRHEQITCSWASLSTFIRYFLHFCVCVFNM